MTWRIIWSEARMYAREVVKGEMTPSAAVATIREQLQAVGKWPWAAQWIFRIATVQVRWLSRAA